MSTTKNRYKLQIAQENVFDSPRTLATDRPVAVYYRQSTLTQVGNISTQLQTVDWIDRLKRLGWKPDNITLVDMDAGISGTKKIDERPGMKYLFELISEGKIGTVACEDEDRLFRDITQIQVNIFIEACRTAAVLVMTPSMVYDFANEQIGSLHARQFRFKSELAAEYINTFVKGKLLRARRWLALEGRWFGGRLPPGYMIDVRKSLPDGSANPHWRKFVPFEPYVEAVNEYFRLFLSHAGNLNATLRDIHLNGPYYPDPQRCLPPSGYRTVYPIKRFKNGYCPGMTGIIHLLTNAVYLGHWMVNDSVHIRCNHPAIVPQDVFWKAFSYLSSVNIDGTPNTTYRPFRENARPSLEADRQVERPLYSGLMYWAFKDKWLRVGVTWIGKSKHYSYQASATEEYDDWIWIRAASYIDSGITRLLHERIRATFDGDIWSKTIAAFSGEFAKETKRTEAQIQALNQFMQNQITSLDVITNPQLIKAVELRYAEAQMEHERLSNVLNHATAEAEKLNVLNELRSSCLPALNEWERLERDQKRVIIRAFIEKIEMHGQRSKEAHLKIYWRDHSTDELVIARQVGKARDWLDSELTQLLSLLDDVATQIDICESFPDRTWESIRHRIWKLRGAGAIDAIDPKPIHDNETYGLYLSRILSKSIAPARAGDRWRSDEIEHLLQLVDSGATQVKISDTFSHRRWWLIRLKITKLRGRDLKIPNVGTVKRNEMYFDYQSRVGEKLNTQLNVAVREFPSQPDFRAGNHAHAP